MRLVLFGLLAFLAMPAPLTQAMAAPAFTPGGEASVREVIDGTTIALTDGRVVHLVGIEVPPRAVPARKAKDALSSLVADQTVTLTFAGTPRDRYGRVAAQVFVGETWVQGELLRKGFARVRSVADNRAGVEDMLTLERQARRYRRGLWADPAYAIVTADAAEKAAGTFALVTGTAATVETRSSGTYVDFGAAPRAGFALSMTPAVVKLCKAAGLDPASLAGKPLLVRGFIDGRLHPTMMITHPEQIEILKAPKKKARDLRPGPDQ
jgi:endonuclease YncB( thermonuclease family)